MPTRVDQQMPQLGAAALLMDDSLVLAVPHFVFII